MHKENIFFNANNFPGTFKNNNKLRKQWKYVVRHIFLFSPYQTIKDSPFFQWIHSKVSLTTESSK